jgi:hypothetical protein
VIGNALRALYLQVTPDSCHLIRPTGYPTGLQSDRSQPLRKPEILGSSSVLVLTNSVGLHLQTNMSRSVLRLFRVELGQVEQTPNPASDRQIAITDSGASVIDANID